MIGRAEPAASAVEEPLLGMRNYYWHGNEPDLVAAWLFAAWSDRAAAARWLGWIVDTMYGTGADGLAGNHGSAIGAGLTEIGHLPKPAGRVEENDERRLPVANERHDDVVTGRAVQAGDPQGLLLILHEPINRQVH